METFDLIIVGAGSGNSILTPDFDDWKVALVERGAFGGTCLNRGCIPSKMFVYAADRAEHAKHSDHLGVDTTFIGARWPEIVQRVFGRIDPIAQGGAEWRAGPENPNLTVFAQDSRFVGPKQLELGDGQIITAETIVLAAGARPNIPPIPGLADVNYKTSADIMRLTELPERLIILGGGFIACEMAHVFGGLGSEVTIFNRSERLLRAQDDAVSEAFTKAYVDRFTVHLGGQITEVAETDGEFSVTLADGTVARGDALLAATGRIPNGTQLNVEAAGVTMDDAGYVITDQNYRTVVDGIWAIGDIQSEFQLKHTANAETKVAAHNIIAAHEGRDDFRTVDYSGVPSAVFASPQIGRVGATEQELQAAGTPYISAVKEYAATAYGWAMEDTTSFCKILADPESRLILGAHVMGPQAATLVQQLVQAYQFGITVDQMATGQMWIHPALSEVIENCLLEL